MKKWLVLSLLVFPVLCSAMEDGESPAHPIDLTEESLEELSNKINVLKSELKEVKEYIWQKKMDIFADELAFNMLEYSLRSAYLESLFTAEKPDDTNQNDRDDFYLSLVKEPASMANIKLLYRMKALQNRHDSKCLTKNGLLKSH